MKVLVTGATGFVGKVTVRELITRGHSVYALARQTAQFENLKKLGAKPFRGDLGNLPSRETLPGFEAVIHLAGIIKASTPDTFYKVNTEGTQKLLEWLDVKILKHFVHVSSISARGPNHNKNDLTGTGPVSHYGKSKLQSESIVSAMLDPKQFTIVRPPVIYGPGDQATLPLFKMFAWGHFFCARKSQTISMVYVEDVARLLATLVSKPSQNVIYPDDGAQGHSLKEILKTASKIFGKPIRQHHLPKTLLASLAATTTVIGRLTGVPLMFNWDKFCEMQQEFWVCDNDGCFAKFNLPDPVSLAKGMALASHL